MSSRRMRSRKQKIKQKRKRKKEVNAKRDEQKQKVMNKGCKKHLMKEKKNVFLERFFFLNKKTEDFFRKKRDKNKQKVSLFAKNLGLNGREWKKKGKKGRSFLEKICEGEW